jgi:hypothetical protein
LHERAQRGFHDYVISQRAIRQQQQKIQVSLAIISNDADIILSKFKLKGLLRLFYHNISYCLTKS